MNNDNLNKHNYLVEYMEDDTCLVQDEAGAFDALVNKQDLQTVLNFEWLQDELGYFTISRGAVVRMPNAILDLPDDQPVSFRNGNAFYDHTRRNLRQHTESAEAETVRHLVEGTMVRFDKDDYYELQLYMYKLKMYQGYVIYLKDRKRVFIHKEIMQRQGVDPDTSRFRFRDGDKTNITKANIRIERRL